jgi:hypothetical protein
VTDGSLAPYLPLPIWNILSGADISYVDGSLTPATVSRTKTHGIKVQLRNNGDNSVELQRPGTKLSFTDGITTYQATLSQNETFGVGVTKEIAFDPVQVPPAIQADQNYDVKLHLVGLENLQAFTLEDSTSSQGDFIRVVTPASVSYAGNLTPTTVTRTVSSSFSLNVSNSGTASVQLTAGSTTFSFDGVTYNATLNPAFATTIAPAATTTLVFNSQVVNSAVGSYTPTLHLVGTENTLAFDATPAVSNQVTVQNPASVNIVAVRPSQPTITRDQTQAFEVTMIVANNSTAEVRFDSAALGFWLGGATDYSNRFIRQAPTGFETNGATLPGGEIDSLIFTVSDNTSNTMTVGSYVIEGNLCVTDVVSQQQICVNTALGGKGSLIVQSPGVLSILSTAASQPSVTTNQTEPWTARMRIQNTGGAEIELDLDAASTFVSFSIGAGWVSTLQTPGPISLAGGVTDTLFFEVTPSGNTAGAATIGGQVRGTELNTGLTKSDTTPTTSGSVLVQTPASLEITSLIKQPSGPVTESQTTAWTIAATVRNNGGATARLSGLAAETYVEFPGSVPPNFRVTGPSGVTDLAGASQTVLTFTVSPTPSFGGVPGSKSFTVRVGGTELNRDLALSANGGGSVVVELQPDPQYVPGSLSPTAVKAGDEVQFRIDVSEIVGAATILLNGATTKLSFSDGVHTPFTRLLDTDSTTSIGPGGTTRVWFETGVVSLDFDAGTWAVTVTIAGTHNGNSFNRILNAGNIEIREPTSVRIDSMVVTRDKVSQSQTRPWEVRMVVSNTGSGNVQVKPGPDTRLVMRVGGVDVTNQYSWTSDFLFEGNGTNVLPSKATDEIVFTINQTGSTTGNLSIYGIFAGRDTGAQKDVGDDTYDSGWGTILVQRAATVQVTGVATSQSTVTEGQTAPWNATVTVSNTGEAALRMTFDGTNPDILFVPDSGFGWTRPNAFLEGGNILPGGESRTMRFTVTQTGSSPGTPVIHAIAAGIDTNSTDIKNYDTRTGSGSGSITVQSRGRAVVQTTTIVSPNAPEVNTGQRFPVRVQIQNAGQASLKNVSYSISSSGASAPQPPDTGTLSAPLIAGGAAVADTFYVTADGVTGPETLTVDVTGATDVNSNQTGLFIDGPDVDSTAVAQKVAPSVLAIDSVTPSQSTVTRSQTADWSVDVAVTNTGGAPLDVVTPAPSDISFRIGGTVQTGYVVLAPTRFVEKAGLRLAAGESATLRYTVDVTGGNTGTVTIRSDLDWRDANDLAVSAAQGAGTVSVVAPSGLFVNTTRADPATAPNSTGNSVRVDSGQFFTVLVEVQNSGGLVEDVDSVQVQLTSNYAMTPVSPVSEYAQILRNQSHTFQFVGVSPAPLSSSASTRTDLFTATIIRAKSMSTGDQVTPGQAVDGTESVIVEKPANLDLNAQAPATVSAEQEFNVQSTVLNTGVGQVDESGELTLRLPTGFTLVATTPDTTVGFVASQTWTWNVKAPSAAVSGQPIQVEITRRPHALNTGLAAAAADSVEILTVDVATQGGFTSQLLEVSAPTGAMDDTVSTSQQFTLRASAIADASTITIVATLVPIDASGFTVIDPLDRSLGNGTGGTVSATWRVTAPATATVVPGSFRVDFSGYDRYNQNNSVQVSTDTLEVTVVRKANLAINALIARPLEATDGVVAIGSRFEIEGWVENLGDAGINPANARATIDFSQASGYSLAAGTAERSFTIGEVITWVVDAPDFPTLPSLIRVSISGVPTDENSGTPSSVTTSLVPIAISTEGVFITADNISASLGFDTRVVPKGTAGIELLGVELANTDDAADPARIDSVLVTVLDKNGAAAGNLSRTLTEFYATIGGYRVDGDLGANPVVFVFTPDNIVLDPNGADTDSIVFAVSLAANAALEELTLSVEDAGHIVIRSETQSTAKFPVVDKSTLQSIVGRLRSSPLVILSDNLQEYAHNYPNPFRAGSQETRIAYLMDKEGPVTVTIFDVTGERVYERQYARGEPGTGAGPQEVTWDGRNTKGDVVRNGIYVCQLEAAGQTVKIRIAVAK